MLFLTGLSENPSTQPLCATFPWALFPLSHSHGCRGAPGRRWQQSPKGLRWVAQLPGQGVRLRKAGAVPTARPRSRGEKVGVRKLTKVGQVPLALPNPLFHLQPLETALIPPRAVAGGVTLLLQN